ncbi:hypothetical protein TYRP_003224 [Tyrophagus putrescentiae]|nr:hypothetical protein TYRP_003224 [Tyrophagus putrescentiae]
MWRRPGFYPPPSSQLTTTIEPCSGHAKTSSSFLALRQLPPARTPFKFHYRRMPASSRASHDGARNFFQDDGISSQERSFSIKMEDEERKLDVNMQAVEKELSGIVIEKSASSEIFDLENISTTSQVDDSMDVKESAKENSTFEDDSVLNYSEISYTQKYTEYERFADYTNIILPYML